MIEAIKRLLARGVSNPVVVWALGYLLQRLDGVVVNSKCHKNGYCRIHSKKAFIIGSDVHVAEKDQQARELGYKNVAELKTKVLEVSEEKIRSIIRGGHDYCEPHEALAVLKTHPVIISAKGKNVMFDDYAEIHYIDGKRRDFNVPKLPNLRTLPLAIMAIRTDTNPQIHMPPGTVPEITNQGLIYPRGTQTIYRAKVSSGKMMAYAYVNSGKIFEKVSGWHIEK